MITIGCNGDLTPVVICHEYNTGALPSLNVLRPNPVSSEVGFNGETPCSHRRNGRWHMAYRETRRSTRVRIKIRIEASGVSEPMTCEGETIVVNRHGALISTTAGLSVGMRIEIHVLVTDKRALAKVVYVDPDSPRQCGIALEKPENIWGIPFPPDDWQENDPA